MMDLSLLREICNWLAEQKSPMAHEYAKQLAKFILNFKRLERESND